MTIDEMAKHIINQLNLRGTLGAYLGAITEQDNIVIRFNNSKIPSILVASHYLNELYMYKYNICKKQKTLVKEKINNQWIHYYPFSESEELINNMMMYKNFLK